MFDKKFKFVKIKELITETEKALTDSHIIDNYPAILQYVLQVLQMSDTLIPNLLKKIRDED